MASKHISRSVTVAPDFTIHKTVDTAVEAAPPTKKEHGVNMGHYEMALIDVGAEGGANPSVAVWWWSEKQGKFVQDHTPISKSGVGVNVGYQFVLPCYGRIMAVTVTGGVASAAQIATISVAGYNLDHSL